MTSPRALALPVAAGLVAAAVTFAVVTAVDGDDEREGAGQPAAAPRAAAPADGRQSFFQMGCGSCHRFADAGSTGTIGPDLDERLAGYDRASLVQTIVTGLRRGWLHPDAGQFRRTDDPAGPERAGGVSARGAPALALVPRARPEGVAHRHGAGDLGLMAE